MRKHALAIAAVAALSLTAACKTASKAADGVASAGESAVQGVSSAATSLVNVNLSNVLNDLALDLKIDKANIPINAQIPITIAANVCGVSINILSVSTGGQANCTAQTSSPELSQVVQQQIAAGGNVGGGAQTTTGGTTTTTTTTTNPTSTTTTPPTTTTTDPQTPQ